MPSGSDVFDKINPKVKLRIQEIIVQSLYESLIAEGKLDPIGKTPHAIAVEFLKLAKKNWATKTNRNACLIITEWGAPIRTTW